MNFLGCNCIEHEVVLDHMNAVRHCSFLNKNYGGRPIIYDNFTGAFTKDDFFEHKRKSRDLFRSGNIPETCKECIHLIEKEWDEENYINYILFTPWTDCNSKCTYCPVTTDNFVIENTKKYDYYSTIKYMFDNGFFVPETIFDFAGGEPTMYERFDDILDLIYEHGHKNVVIHTNAIKYSKNIEKLISTGRCKVLTSIDAGNRELFYKIKQVDNFDKVCETISKYAAAQSVKPNAMKTKYILMPGVNDTEEYILEWLDLNKKFGIISVVLNLDFNWLVPSQDLIKEQRLKSRGPENTTLKLYDLIEFTKKEAEKRGIVVSLYGEIFTLKTLVEGEVTHNIVDD